MTKVIYQVDWCEWERTVLRKDAAAANEKKLALKDSGKLPPDIKSPPMLAKAILEAIDLTKCEVVCFFAKQLLQLCNRDLIF
jgi:hypothetical protein